MNVEKIFLEIDKMISSIGLDNYSVLQKRDESFVTSLDIEIQNRIVNIILDEFPTHRILYEEGDQKYLLNRSKFTWIIDPIDGTKNFIDKKREFGISVGLMYKCDFICAYVNFPAIKESYCTLFNSGVLKNWIPFEKHFLEQESKEIILCSKTYYNLRSLFESYNYEVACYYCATYSMLRVLKGEALMYHTINTNIYDVGPMSYILGKVRITSYDHRFKFIKYEASVKKIPFFIATRNEALLNIFRGSRVR